VLEMHLIKAYDYTADKSYM